MRDFRLSTAQRSWRVSTWFLALAAAGAGCALEAPDRGVVIADGVARATFQARARHTDLVDVEVYFPSDAQGVRLGEELPALLFIHGGLVSSDRYGWLGQALARDGFVVAMPAHPLDLAFFAIENGHAARDLLVKPPAGSVLEGAVDPDRIVVAGHSLGGVVAAKLALDGGYAGLAILASFVDPADDARLPQLGRPALVLAAEKDCQARLEDGVRQGYDKLPAPAALAIVRGATHYQFTDDDRTDVERDCPPELPIALAHARIAGTLRIFAVAAGVQGTTGATELAAIEGVEVTSR